MRMVWRNLQCSYDEERNLAGKKASWSNLLKVIVDLPVAFHAVSWTLPGVAQLETRYEETMRIPVLSTFVSPIPIHPVINC